MPIRSAILSVSDKTGLVAFAKALVARNVTLVSTGGTYSTLKASGIPVESVENYTGSPEVMSGRVKTLHPRVHGGILARDGLDDADLERLGARLIDLVVVNLYPFEQTLAKPGTSFETLIENIDLAMSDEVAAWDLESDGTWTRRAWSEDGAHLADLQKIYITRQPKRRAIRK